MNRIFITLALLLVSQMTFAQTTDKLIQALNKVEDTEVPQEQCFLSIIAEF